MSLGNLADTNPKQIRVKKKNKKADSGGPGSSCRVGFRIDAPTPNSASLISLGEAWKKKKGNPWSESCLILLIGYILIVWILPRNRFCISKIIIDAYEGLCTYNVYNIGKPATTQEKASC